MKNAFLLLLICSFWGSSSLLHAQEDENRWEYFYFVSAPLAMTQTATHLWVAYPEGILQVDKTNDEIEMLHPLRTIDYVDSYKDIWVNEQNEIHFVSEGNRVGHFDGENWQVARVPFANNLFTVEKILHQYDNGDYLLRGKYAITFFRWRSNMSFPQKLNGSNTGGFDWNAEDAILGPQQKLWAWEGDQLAYLPLDNTLAIPYELPATVERIESLQFDPSGRVWLHADNGLWLEAESGWEQFAFAGEELLNFQFKNQEQVLLTFTDRVLLLSLEQNQLQATDVSTDFYHAPLSGHSLFAANEQLWYVGKNASQLWTKTDQSPPTKIPNFSLLPLSNNQNTEMQRDAEGRIWLYNVTGTFFYAEQQWISADQLFPNFPDTVFQILFTATGDPIVLHSKADTLALSVRNNTKWWQLPNPNNITSLAPISSTFRSRNLFLDRNGDLWQKSSFPSSLHLWQANRWISLFPNDFSPNPRIFRDIDFSKNNHLAITSNTGLHIHDGFYSEFFSLTDLGLDNSYYHVNSSEKEGNLWINNLTDIFIWQQGEAIKIPLTDKAGDPLDIMLGQCYPFADNDVWCSVRIEESVEVIHYNGHFWQIHTLPDDSLAAYLPQELKQDAEGNIWIKNQNGIAVYHPQSDRSVATASTNQKSLFINISPSPACCYIQVSWINIVADQVSIQLYNTQGQLIRTLAQEWQEAGEQHLSIVRDGLPAGLYYLRVRSGNTVENAAVVFE